VPQKLCKKVAVHVQDRCHFSPGLIYTLELHSADCEFAGGVFVNLSSSAAYITLQLQIFIGHGHCPISLLIRTAKFTKLD
jgi:hypothetical protein